MRERLGLRRIKASTIARRLKKCGLWKLLPRMSSNCENDAKTASRTLCDRGRDFADVSTRMMVWKPGLPALLSTALLYSSTWELTRSPVDFSSLWRSMPSSPDVKTENMLEAHVTGFHHLPRCFFGLIRCFASSWSFFCHPCFRGRRTNWIAAPSSNLSFEKAFVMLLSGSLFSCSYVLNTEPQCLFGIKSSLATTDSFVKI